jgi:propanol-preferring alcohol dehydrogenase
MVMRAWAVTAEPSASRLLREVDRPAPEPAADEVLVRVEACGVCRTDLHLAEGDLTPRRPEVVPGHEAVGRVLTAGTEVSRFEVGDRVGVPWLRRTCGQCRWCRAGAENLCPRSTYTGWDADGGFAELLTAPAAFVYSLPDDLPALDAAPLLCAGIIGYRALCRAALPPGGRLGIYGFGASAHLTAQLALAQGAEVHVLTRGAGARALALELGAASAGEAYDAPPVPLDSAIVFAPAGELVPRALAALGPGGTVSLAGIHMSDVPAMDYASHLFRERTLTSVTANTRADGERLLALAARLGVRARITAYPLAEADRALRDLRDGAFSGAAVLTAG